MTKQEKFIAQVSPVISERKKIYGTRKSTKSIADFIYNKYAGTGTKITDIKELYGEGEYFHGILEFVK